MLLTREQLQERLIALHQASLELVKDVSLETLLERIATVACEQADARYAALGVLDHHGKLDKFISVGMNGKEIKRISHPPEGRGLLGELMNAKEPLRVPVIREHPKSVGFPAHHPPMKSDPRLAGDYLDYLAGLVRGVEKRRAGLKAVVDCANGAGSSLGPRLLGRLGFDVEALHAAPDGRNINAGCGSLHPQKLAARVRETGAAIGIALDGDADRALWVDGDGRLLSGDHTLFVQAVHMRETGRLKTKEIVATTMSNMGLERAFEERGLGLVRTKVGDKYVHEEMVARGG